MATVRHELVWGRPGAPRLELVGGFAVIVVATLLATVATNTLGTDNPIRRVVYDAGLPAVLFYAPGVVGAVGAYLRCGAATCLAVGFVPATFFALVAIVGSVFGLPGVGGGDAPLWSITVAFATIALVAAVVGFLAGTAIRAGVTAVSP
ncbi:hypothetical protein [Natronobacterium gregoryi]|uniref:Uncharacterized protein n=2 Tax=Natronobacterium gregoryi TaxID=44930 RepID=L0ANE6_NATGS|nr:hypothetical protein [Natronobacterium gregoryi]AFZ74717.1 hypothetical protein Natgr_3604 [Natronobacterium gregoryi SP2]ELY73476.1 hypothetical protein C490_01385 [Natronobacterium gregoryi SP2]PLK20961.1 hypothetical protein CYV19_06785 [Natronobacterium gregoryi SP2]SFJ04179.1 hypothetical protein SAMN05443661_11240 [Natronobacterium gregoryi]